MMAVLREVMMLKYAAFFIALAAAAPAVGQAPPTQTATVKTPATVNPLDKIICRTEEGLGSRLNRKKVCMTVRDWKDQADDSRDAVERIQQGQGVVPSG